MQVIIPNWLQPTNTLGAISAGAQAGLGLRAAAQREREAAAQEALARDRMAQEAAEAEQAMLYRNQSLMAQINNQLRDEAFAQRELDTKQKQFDVKSALDKKDSDLLADYRTKMAAAREAEIASKKAPKVMDIGGIAYRVEGDKISVMPEFQSLLDAKLKEKPVYETVRTVEHFPEVKAKDAVTEGWFGRGPIKTPAVSYQPKRDVTKTERIPVNSLSQEEINNTIARAADAIRRKPEVRDEVIRRLKAAGIDPGGL